MSPITLKCASCGSALKAEDWDTAAGIIKCSYCRALMTVPKSQATSEVPAFRPRGSVPMPPGLTCETTGANVVITRRWFTPAALFLAFFCVAWDGFLVFWYGMAFSMDAPWIFKLFPLIHVAVGVGLTYSTLTMFFNRTIIQAGQGWLSIEHGPLPWKGGGSWEAGQFDQLYCKSRISHSKNGTQVNYEIHAALRDGTSRQLLGTGLTEEQALFIEQRIEQALAITDREVPGELPR